MTIDVSRRRAMALAALPLASALAWGREQPPMPGMELPRPFMVDGKKVLEFFTFTCPYCREMSGNFAYWGKSLPGGLLFESVPVLTGRADVTPALFFYAVREVAPEKLGIFCGHAFSLVQDANRPSSLPATYLEALDRAGINRAAVDKAVRGGKVQAFADMALQRTRAYKVEYTPSLAIMGRYLIHAGHSNGDYKLLLQLANGLISQYVAR
ncbi:thioredoxin domain-containing protein [Chromobacterium sp. IIBBL 290-4]|uniref:thioredoxin domain-containing protein n=1 Tax=Chromobacterium sp. IIBBL 290-4 TaxID=2953890 RepID=UPI0020B86BA6|nr:thioredoxin domain-containing protein [Chromobacterium sp. IIBBL 290-4]UTH74246.1 thioredoxin domain-containing protein [Chromobacterium sp. IIBBL 290-4]